MITLTTQQDRYFKQGFKVKYQLLIKDNLGTWRDLSNLVNQDWVYSITINSDIDNLLNTADIELIRGAGNLCISPLNTVSLLNKLSGSYVPLVNLNREIKVNVQYVPDLSASVSSYLTIFHGYIDSFSIEPDNSLRINCRDLGAFLQDRFIEEERIYPHTSATPPEEYEEELVHVVMQQILNDNLGAGTIVLYTPVNPGWMIKKYRQSKVNLLDAVNALASQIGYSVRYKYDSTASVWKLTFYCPDRDKSTSDYTFDGNHILNVSNVSLDISGIRNVIRIYYGPVDEEHPEKRQYVQKTDTDSIALYGRKYMEIAEGSTSHIDEYVEAENLANIALKDLKDPKANIQVEIPFFPFVELGDLYTFKGNNDFFTDDLQLAVVSYSHNLSAGNISTSLTCRGKPAGAYIRWHQQNAVWQGTHKDSAPEPPTIVDVEPQALGFLVTLSNPTSVDWDGYEVYMSRINGFIPSLLNQVARGRLTKFNILTLNTNARYYFKALAYDKYGNKSDYSPQVSNIPSRVSVEGISDDYIGRSFYTSFEDDTNDDGIPDGFSVTTTNGSFSLTTEKSFYGFRSIKMATNEGGGTVTAKLEKFIPCSYLDVPLLVKFMAYPDTGAHGFLYLKVYEYDGNHTLINTLTYEPIGNLEISRIFKDYLVFLNMYPQFNSNTKFIEIEFELNDTGLLFSTSNVCIDDLEIKPLPYVTTTGYLGSIPKIIPYYQEIIFEDLTTYHLTPSTGWVKLKEYTFSEDTLTIKNYVNFNYSILWAGDGTRSFETKVNVGIGYLDGRNPKEGFIFTPICPKSDTSPNLWNYCNINLFPFKSISSYTLEVWVNFSQAVNYVEIKEFHAEGNRYYFVV